MTLADVTHPSTTTHRRTLVRAALTLAAVALAPACYSPTDGGGGGQRNPEAVFILPASDLSATLRDADDEEVASLEIEHLVGVTECPQLLGTLTVDNASDVEATATLAVPADPPLAIVIDEGEVMVPAGESVVIEIMFDCSATDDIDTTMDLALQTGSRIGTFSIGLGLDVKEG